MSRATEEDWARREMHRAAGLAAVCRTNEYQALKMMLESELVVVRLKREDPARFAAAQALQHPSPTDRSLSKRKWERAVQEWRRELRALGESLS